MSGFAINLRSVDFERQEQTLARYEGLTASAFRYSSGVAGLRIANQVGHVDVLPFQGQQIWDAQFFGRSLAMKTMFPEPVATRDYLATYGAFFLHCGGTAMGNPRPQDTHALHGELPNAIYQQAELVAGRDAEGAYIGLSGACRHAIAFHHHFEARPVLKIHEGSGLMRMTLTVLNLRPVPMDFMYLAHINFRPADGGRLIDTVPDELAHMRVRSAALPGFKFSEAHEKLLASLRKDPSLHRKVGVTGTPDGTIAPELVIAMDCRAGADGWAHCLQRHANGAGDLVSHRPLELAHGVRWMTRTGDFEAMGMMLPATAEPDGYTAEKAKGNVRLLPPHGNYSCDMVFGALEPAATKDYERKIANVMRG